MTGFHSSVRRATRFAVCADRWQWVLLLAAAPFLLFPSAAFTPVLLVVPAMWIAAWIAGREPLPRTPLNGALGVLFFMVLVSTWATYDMAQSLSKVAGVVLGIGVFFVFARSGEHPIHWWVGLLVFLAAGLGIAVIGLFGTQFGTKIGVLVPITSRLTPSITGLPGAELGFSPNELAGAVVWVLPLLINLALLAVLRNDFLRRRIGAAWARVVAGSLVLSVLFVFAIFVLFQSRGGYLGFVIAEIAALLVVAPPRARWALIGALVGLGILGLYAVRVNPDFLVLLFWGSNDVNAYDPTATIETVNGRMELWVRAICGIQDFPLTGMGMNTFRRVVHVLYPLVLIAPDTEISHAHNEFLQAALDLGIPGLIAFVALYLIAFWILAQVWKSAEGFALAPLTRAIALGCGAGLGAHMIYGMTEVVALGAKPGFVFWMLLGLVAGLYQQTRSGQMAAWLTIMRRAGFSQKESGRGD
jgi:putative inorganic carbon (HCO3(-)) transporter